MAAAGDEMSTMPALPVRRAGSGEPLVLVHGFLGGSAQWAAELTRLGQHFDVIAPDLAGYGDASDRAAPSEIALHAKAVLATLDALGIEQFHLLGHSMGGMIVQEMVHQAPSRVRRLILYATAAQGSIPGRFETMERSRERLVEEGFERVARRTSATWLLEREASPAYPALAALALRSNAQAARAGLDAMEGWDGRDRLGTIGMPTLVLWGEGDRSYGWPLIEMLWRTIPGASLAVLPTCSHALHLERAALFHAIVHEFLRSPVTARG
jgi:pimeloyl-ACP methyl ester carboxylesterase